MESTTEYPPKSILRFFPSPDQTLHYSAVILNDHTILQVKTPTGNTKEHFDSLEKWLNSIPQKPTLNQLTIDTQPTHKTSRHKSHHDQKNYDEKNQEEKDWMNRKQINLSTRKTIYPLSYASFRTFPWLRLIHQYVKEANPSLLKQEVFIRAFNYLIEFMIKHSDHIITYINPHKKFYYDSPLSFNLSDSSPFKQFPIRIHTSFVILPNGSLPPLYQFINMHDCSTFQLKKEGHELIRELYDTYQPVYELIKTDVIPYIQQKNKKTIAKHNIQCTRLLLNHTNKKFEHKRIIYEKGIERLHRNYENSVKYFQQRINELTSKLEQYARESV